MENDFTFNLLTLQVVIGLIPSLNPALILLVSSMLYNGVADVI